MQTGNLKLPAPSIDTFNQSRTPQVGGYEVFEDFIYDTITVSHTATGVQTIDIFATQTNDETLSNLKAPGQIPKPDKFHAYQLFVVPITNSYTETDGTAADVANDISKVLYSNRGIIKLTPSTTGRTRPGTTGGIPLWALGQVRAMEVSGWGSSAVANSRALAMSGAGGYPFELALDSTEEIRGTLKFGNAQALSADLQLVVALYGWRYKSVG